MVRLLQPPYFYPLLVQTLFQSHNGAIAANYDTGDVNGLYEFQSHNGAIAAR